MKNRKETSMSIFSLYLKFTDNQKTIKHRPSIDILYLNNNNVWSEKIVKIILDDNPKVKMTVGDDKILLNLYKNSILTSAENCKEYIQDNWKNGLKMVTSNKKTTIK
jgi:hypothetical protein